jgi:hypothetical protein
VERRPDLPPFEFEAPAAPADPPPAVAAAPPPAAAPAVATPAPFDRVDEVFFSSAPGAARTASGPEPVQAARPAPDPTGPPILTRVAPPAVAPAQVPTAPAPAIAVPVSEARPAEPPSLTALADRALDADVQVAVAACEALAGRRRESAIRAANEKLRRALLSGISAKATKAARALGAIRDVEAIPLLIQVLETSEPETARASADALAAITLQRLGTDARKWLNWWKQNRGRGRAEWLFSGLTSADRETRVAASVELSLAAPPPVAYSADLPPAELEKTARAWAGWWARSGHVL